MIQLVIPFYNNRETIGRALASVAAQTKKRKVLTMIVDDDSTEDISDIVETFKKLIPLSYYKIPHVGKPGIVRQFGLDKTNCEYIMFMDADDILMPRAVEVLGRAALQEKPDVIIGHFNQENEDGTLHLWREQDITWLHGNLYNVEFLRKYNIHFSDHFNEDGSFNTQVQFLSKEKRFVAESMYIWMDNKKSLTRSNNTFMLDIGSDFIQTYNLAYQNILKNMEPTDHLYAALGHRLSHFYCLYNALLFNEREISMEVDKGLFIFFSMLEDIKAFENIKFKQELVKGLNSNIVFSTDLPQITLKEFLSQFYIEMDIKCNIWENER